MRPFHPPPYRPRRCSGLAHYLNGDLEDALRAYRECLKVSDNPDMLVATSHWLCMTLRRLGRAAEAAAVLEPIDADMDIIENGSYHPALAHVQRRARDGCTAGGVGVGWSH